MNRIAALKAKSKFVPEEHLVLTVDGVPLDAILGEAFPQYDLVGLVSSLLGWFHRDEDGLAPWQRILPGVGCSSWAPILICPDDLDYSCTTMIVEVAAEPDSIRWERFGLDATPRRNWPVGSQVRWLSGVGPYRFARADYERCLAAFKPAHLGADAGLDAQHPA
jgi:hypothetical protein